MKYITTINDQEYTIEIDQEDRITVNGEPYTVDFQAISEGGILSLLLNQRSLEAIVEARDDLWDVLLKGELYTARVLDERAYRLSKARGVLGPVTGEAMVAAPMPGVILEVPVKEGDAVKQHETVVILESMKMENELRAPRDGVVRRVATTPGDSVEKGQVLVVIGDA